MSAISDFKGGNDDHSIKGGNVLTDIFSKGGKRRRGKKTKSRKRKSSRKSRSKGKSRKSKISRR